MYNVCIFVYVYSNLYPFTTLHIYIWVRRTYVYYVQCVLLPYFFYNYLSCLNFFHLSAYFVFVRTSMYMPIIYFAVFFHVFRIFRHLLSMRLCESAYAFTRSFVRTSFVSLVCTRFDAYTWTSSQKTNSCARRGTAHTIGCTRKMLTFEPYI